MCCLVCLTCKPPPHPENQGSGISPGKCTTIHTEKMNRKRENEKARRNTVEFKRKRLELKNSMFGLSYQHLKLTCERGEGGPREFRKF